MERSRKFQGRRTALHLALPYCHQRMPHLDGAAEEKEKIDEDEEVEEANGFLVVLNSEANGLESESVAEDEPEGQRGG